MPALKSGGGRIIKPTGDGFLIERPSVQGAVACAIALQENLKSSPLKFRMGINVGDITDDGGDMHGERINIAARLEALTEPGGILYLRRRAYRGPQPDRSGLHGHGQTRSQRRFPSGRVYAINSGATGEVKRPRRSRRGKPL